LRLRISIFALIISISWNALVFAQRFEVSAGFGLSDIDWRHDFANKVEPWYEFDQKNYRGGSVGLQVNYLKKDFYYFSSRASLSLLQGNAHGYSWIKEGYSYVLLNYRKYFMAGFTELNTNVNFYFTKNKIRFLFGYGPQLNISTNIFKTNPGGVVENVFSKQAWPDGGFKSMVIGANGITGIKFMGSKFTYGINFEYFFPFTRLINYTNASGLTAKMKIYHIGLGFSFGFL